MKKSTMDDIESALRALADRLRHRLALVDLRGDGASQFLYLIGNGRSTEVSRHEDGFWLELWDSLEESALPIAEVTVSSIEEVESALLDHFAVVG